MKNDSFTVAENITKGFRKSNSFLNSTSFVAAAGKLHGFASKWRARKMHRHSDFQNANGEEDQGGTALTLWYRRWIVGHRKERTSCAFPTIQQGWFHLCGSRGSWMPKDFAGGAIPVFLVPGVTSSGFFFTSTMPGGCGHKLPKPRGFLRHPARSTGRLCGTGNPRGRSTA